MKISSAKAKGRKLQNYVRDKLRKLFIDNWTLYPKLEYDDIKSQTMGMTGEDIVLSPAARKIIPFSFECKNVEKLNIWEALNQAESNSGDNEPVLIIKRNRTKVYAVMELDGWLSLLRSKHNAGYVKNGTEINIKDYRASRRKRSLNTPRK
tara:strand:- start:98 stop:550 length:453 start_codon:yes stop_codon:yes gene_type:complete